MYHESLLAWVQGEYKVEFWLVVWRGETKWCVDHLVLGHTAIMIDYST
jgi:hypothetical protein